MKNFLQKFRVSFNFGLVSVFAIGFLLAFASIAYADINEQVPIESWVFGLIQFITEVKGLSTIGIVVGVVQLITRLFKTPLGNIAGLWRLVVVSGLTAVGLLVGALAAGESIWAALISAPFIAAAQVFGHQLLKQIGKLPEDSFQVIGKK